MYCLLLQEVPMTTVQGSLHNNFHIKIKKPSKMKVFLLFIGFDFIGKRIDKVL